ncbi:L,D-transpeptidase [Bifidobacterium sp. SO4]|uniref:L,D-transpeptidase n=1 Tax=Bifidobacterium sp. SO4 TaxID=2809030 RepID=UPI001BDC3D89|nr:L,D-transpeptidase [Bifidobacterium sp. SO4]MBT1170765.1 L,D-transpeptidase [Bifidobacterium sp. SO4]
MTDVTTSFPRPDDEQTAVLRPVGFDGMPKMAAADDAVKAGGHMAHAKRHGKAWIVVLASVFAVILAAFIAYFFVGRWYFQDKAAPGVYLGDVSVMGQTRDELKDTVKQQLKTTTVTFTADGKSAEASLADMGVTADADKTVDALMNAKTGDFAKLNILNQVHVPLSATTNDTKAEQYVTDNLVDESDRVKITTVSYDKDAKQFVFDEGHDGKAPQMQAVTAAVKQAVATPGTNTTVAVKLESGTNPIDSASAQQVAADANARLGLNLTVDNGVNKSITIPVEQIAKFLKPTTDLKTGTMSLIVDRDAINSYVSSAAVTKELTVEKVDREVYITPKSEGGVRIGADKTLGVDGIKVTGVGDAPAKLATAIEQNQSTDSTVAVTDSPYEVKEVEVPHNFDVANGDKWVHVDLTNQTATAYQGTTPVKTFLIASGKPTADGSMLSDTGTFYVYLKYESQTMSGEGYNQPNTPWVSYYNGGEALHGVPAYMWGEHPIYVQQGIPGSHGCINMQVADAKWMYDFATIGTKVVVDGVTPTSGQAIRAAGADATGWRGN